MLQVHHPLAMFLLLALFLPRFLCHPVSSSNDTCQTLCKEESNNCSAILMGHTCFFRFDGVERSWNATKEFCSQHNMTMVQLPKNANGSFMEKLKMFANISGRKVAGSGSEAVNLGLWTFVNDAVNLAKGFLKFIDGNDITNSIGENHEPNSPEDKCLTMKKGQHNKTDICSRKGLVICQKNILEVKNKNGTSGLLTREFGQNETDPGSLSAARRVGRGKKPGLGLFSLFAGPLLLLWVIIIVALLMWSCRNQKKEETNEMEEILHHMEGAAFQNKGEVVQMEEAVIQKEGADCQKEESDSQNEEVSISEVKDHVYSEVDISKVKRSIRYKGKQNKAGTSTGGAILVANDLHGTSGNNADDNTGGATGASEGIEDETTADEMTLVDNLLYGTSGDNAPADDHGDTYASVVKAEGMVPDEMILVDNDLYGSSLDDVQEATPGVTALSASAPMTPGVRADEVAIDEMNPLANNLGGKMDGLASKGGYGIMDPIVLEPMIDKGALDITAGEMTGELDETPTDEMNLYDNNFNASFVFDDAIAEISKMADEMTAGEMTDEMTAEEVAGESDEMTAEVAGGSDEMTVDETPVVDKHMYGTSDDPLEAFVQKLMITDDMKADDLKADEVKAGEVPPDAATVGEMTADAVTPTAEELRAPDMNVGEVAAGAPNSDEMKADDMNDDGVTTEDMTKGSDDLKTTDEDNPLDMLFTKLAMGHTN